MKKLLACLLTASAAALSLPAAEPSELPLVPQPRSFTLTKKPLPPEGYRLVVKGGKATIEAADDAGRFYANETLKQLGANPPDLEIEDWPQYKWRGLHMDPSRHFFTVAETKRFIDLMAQHKFNVFHWHLTDDQGWRFPVKSQPKLNTVGATREAKKGLTFKFKDDKGGTYGPFGFTPEEIRDVVAFAAARHITVVPEIEMPGHSAEVVRAYPELSCFGKTTSDRLKNDWNPEGTVKSVCPGKDATLAFFKGILDEACALFPGETIHIGGDECGQADWEHCPNCQARMKAHGLKTTHELQSWFMKQMVDHLTKKGKKVIGWDELLEGGLPEGAKVMSWRGPEGGIKAAKAGVDAVMCPEAYCYFDMGQSLADDPCDYPTRWGKPVSVETVYKFDPVAGVPASAHKHILGGQGNNWAEFTCTEKELDWKCWTRAAALAEALWTAPKDRNWRTFQPRLVAHRERLVAQGVNCAPVLPLAKVGPEGAEVVAGPEGRSTPFKTERNYRDVQLHFEWLLRDERARKIGGNFRNLARVVFAGAGAIQLCDAYLADGRTVGDNVIPADSTAGAIVHQNPPIVNSIRGYDQWNSVDVIYHAGVWEGSTMVKAPEITVFQNGVLVQDHWAMEGEDRWIFRPEKPTKPKGGKAPISFERGPVNFRNVWAREI